MTSIAALAGHQLAIRGRYREATLVVHGNGGFALEHRFHSTKTHNFSLKSTITVSEAGCQGKSLVNQ